jgi:hypothetical protein
MTHTARQWIFLTVAGCFVLSAQADAQIVWGKQTLNRGKLWETVWNSFQYGDPTETYNAYFTLDYPGYSKGTDVGDALNYAEAGGYAIYGVRDGTAGAYTINSRFAPSGQYVFPIEEALLTNNYNLADLSTPGEQIVTGAHHINALNVDVSRRSMAWSIPGYDSFVIHEVTITNNDFSPVTDLFFGQRYGLRFTQRSGTRGDEKYGWDEVNRLFYFYDDWSFRFQDEVPVTWTYGVGPLRGDIFDSRDRGVQGSREHELDAPGFLTVIVLDSANSHVTQNILEHVGQGVTEGAPKEDIMFIQGHDPASLFRDIMSHEQPHMSWDSARAAGKEGGNKFERRPEFLVSVGPMTLPPFGSLKIVFAEVIGEMDRAKIVEGGVANIDLNATASRDSLIAHVRAARQLYKDFYMPRYLPPPTPTNGENSLSLSTLPGQVVIDWPPVPSTYKDPLKGVNDFAGYKVYRSTYFTIGPWTLVATIPKDSVTIVNGKVRYIDGGLPFGVGNYYCVTSYDTDGFESGKVNNNRFPVYPLRAPNPEFPRSVYVVPNPFRQHSGLIGQGERSRMEFIGIPAQCTIRIYTLVGDLVKEISHNDGSGSEAWGSVARLDYQLNKWLLGVAPGIYLFRVESHVAGHEGESAIGKFAIMK